MHEFQTKITFEAEASGLIEGITKNVLEKFKKDTGKEESPVYYYTFIEEDYDLKLIRLIVTNSQKNKIYVTIPEEEDEAKKAWDYFIKLNSHLQFMSEMKFGYNNDDFIHNRVTVQIYFSIPKISVRTGYSKIDFTDKDFIKGMKELFLKS